MKIKYGIFALMLILVALLSGGYTYQNYSNQRDSLMKGIDKKLYAAAMMARAILPQDYHDKILDSSSITKKEFDEIISKYNKLCVDLDLEYLWSLMIINDKIVFTSSTSPDKNTKNQKHAKFFELHSNPELYEKTFSTKKAQYQQIIDKWGKIQTVLIPFIDSHGRPYLFGASMKLSEVDSLLRQNIRDSIYFGLWFLFVGLILSYVLSKLLSMPLDTLVFEISKIASGQLDKTVEEKGFYEQVVLARSFNQMAFAIKGKIAALAESGEKYRSMMESMDDPAYICSKDFRVEYMNPAMIKRVGYDAIGELCYKTMHALKEKCPWCVHETVMKGESIKTDVVSPKDNKTYFYVSHSPIFHADGSISKLTVFRDVTEIKEMELRVQQSQKMESIGTLAGGIAHDFNNILYPIVGHTEMLLEDFPDAGSTRDSLNAIYTGSLRARDLVQQILAFARQEKTELKLMKMRPIIKEAMKLIRSTIPATISIRQDLQPNCGPVSADPTHIHQIVMNLATNAYHAMEENGGELNVNLKEIELGEYDLITPDMSPGLYACLSISDTGRGMNRDVMTRIFDPFFTTKEKGKGTGMGLSVVHGIVKHMNGEIRVYSEPGKGAEFQVYLPVVGNASEKQEQNANEPIPGGCERVLLVDDEEAIIEMEKQILERLGYQVSSRVSSIEALEAFRANPDKFDLVITDMFMPKMSGDKLAVELIKIRPDIPVLLCTGYSARMTDEKIKSLGIRGFLMKPIISRDFAKKIRKVLD
jgi:PAS domain S-box-containing protein